MIPTETGLVIPVPSLEDFVAAWRPKVDREVPEGVPAHVTVLYPFLSPGDIDEVVEDLRSFLAEWPSFPYTLEDVGWFGNRVVFVRPQPSVAFMGLTDAMSARYGVKPYGGEIEDPQPHVTVGFEGKPEDMRRVARAAAALLPIESQRADEVWLVQGTPKPPRWTRTHRFDLGSNTL